MNNLYKNDAKSLRDIMFLIESYFSIYGAIELNDEYTIIKSDNKYYISNTNTKVHLLSEIAQLCFINKNKLRVPYRGPVKALENWLDNHNYYEYTANCYYN